MAADGGPLVEAATPSQALPMAGPHNTRFEEAFSKTRAWNNRAQPSTTATVSSAGPSNSVLSPSAARSQHHNQAFSFQHHRQQQSSISSQSSFTSDESNTTDVSPFDPEPARPYTMSRSVGSSNSQGPTHNNSGGVYPQNPTATTQSSSYSPPAAPTRPVHGLKSLKLGSVGSRSGIYNPSKQLSQSSTSSSSSPTADTSMTTSESLSPSSSSHKPSEDALTDLINQINASSAGSTGASSAAARSRVPFQRSQSENGRDQYGNSTNSSAAQATATLYRSALNRHARNQSTDSAGSVLSDDGAVSSASSYNLPHHGSRGARSTTARSSPPSQLSRRDLSHKNLEDLPFEMMQSMVGQIEYLNLGYNRIQSLPRQFLVIGATLRTLDIRANGVVVFPSILCELSALECLDISRNKIETLPERPGRLKRLQVFIVNKNRIRRLPQWIAQMTNLTHLKVDHNPLEWPPRSIASYPKPSSPTGPVPPTMDRSSSDRSLHSAFSSAAAAAGSSSTETDGVMHKWIVTLQEYLRDHGSVPADAEGPQSGSDVAPPHPGRPKLLAIKTSPMPPAAPAMSPNLTHHGRNASASGSGMTRSTGRPELRSKKSLPDLRIGQTPSPSTSSFSGTATPANPENFPPMPSPSAAISFNELHNPKVRVVDPGGDDGKPAPGERNSGAYFRRLSMLPANTASKALPMPVLEMVDGIRGILFSLSQIYSALKHFVLFATQDRLSVALTKLMTTADVAMGSLINALDRFDSSSRRRQAAEANQIARDVFEACRSSVGVFSRLVGVLGLQLKHITTQSDTRYVRTLLLMLYGSLGEISVAWQSMAPHAAQVAQYLSSSSAAHMSSPKTNGASHLQPLPPASSSRTFTTSPTPDNDQTPQPKKQSSLSITTSQPLTPKPSAENLTARARRHAGSFSVEDVQMGAHLPPAMSPTLSSPLSSISASTSLPAPLTAASTESITSTLKAPVAMRPRHGAPALAALPIGQGPSGMPYMDLMATLEGQPPTPMAPLPPPLQHSASHTTVPLHRSQPSSSRATNRLDTARPALNAAGSRTQAQAGYHPQPPTSATSLMMPPRSASFSTSARPNSPYATRQADSDYFDIVEQTTTVVFSVCNMLVESLSESNARQGSKSISDLLELCDMSIQAARRLTSSLENTQMAEAGPNPELLAVSNQHLCDDSSVFSRAVMQTAKLATDLAPELGFPKPVREGLSQMSKSTYSLLALLAVTYGK